MRQKTRFLSLICAASLAGSIADAQTKLPLTPTTALLADRSPMVQLVDGHIITGYDLGWVQYNGGNFWYMGDGEWVEADPEGNPSFYFEEVGRDTDYVFLLDTSRNVQIAFGLDEGIIFYAPGNDDWTELYQITALDVIDGTLEGVVDDSEVYSDGHGTGPEIDGWNIGYAAYDGGQFWRNDDGGWVEANPQGQISFKFVELDRDETYVYLRDLSRNMDLAIDVPGRAILLWSNDTWSRLYAVTEIDVFE